MFRRIRNVIRSDWGWSFNASSLERSRHVLAEGERIAFPGSVCNTGLRVGTPYVRIVVADSNKLNEYLFDSKRDLPLNVRHSLRLVDIAIGESRQFACSWSVPVGTNNRHFDVRLQVWNPHLLFNGPKPYMFFDSGWIGGFEVVSHLSSQAKPVAFIFYSWDSEEHKAWVHQLAEELRKFNIQSILDREVLLAGDDVTQFMEQGITETKVRLLVCSENYTTKANSRSPGGVGFESVITSHEYMNCSPDERGRFIPVVRNNKLPPRKKLPTYLGSAYYIDMEGENWRAEPILDLVASINRHF